MRPHLFVIEGGRVVERRREPEANPLFILLLWVIGFYCLFGWIFDTFVRPVL